MKIGERLFEQDGKLVLQETFDLEGAAKRAEMFRKAGNVRFGESVHVGSFTRGQLDIWLKEAGVRWDDRPAVQEVIRKKMLDGDFAKYRVWQGTY